MSKLKWHVRLWSSVAMLILIVYLSVNALLNYSIDGYTIIRSIDLAFITIMAMLNIIVDDIWPMADKYPKSEPKDE